MHWSSLDTHTSSGTRALNVHMIKVSKDMTQKRRFSGCSLASNIVLTWNSMIINQLRQHESHAAINKIQSPTHHANVIQTHGKFKTMLFVRTKHAYFGDNNPLYQATKWYLKNQSSGAVWELRWTSWAVCPNEPSGFRGRKDLLNRTSVLVTTCPEYVNWHLRTLSNTSSLKEQLNS